MYRRSKSQTKIQVPDPKSLKLSKKGFGKLKGFYESVFEKITSRDTEVLFSSKYTFIKILKETEEFLNQFWRKGKESSMMNSTLFMAALMKLHHFCLKNFLMDLQKRDYDSFVILKNLEEVFRNNFNIFISKIKSNSKDFLNKRCGKLCKFCSTVKQRDFQ